MGSNRAWLPRGSIRPEASATTAPAAPAVSAPTPPASTRATARSTRVIPSARSMRWTWRRPPWWRSSPWATISSPPSPTTTPNTTSPASRTTCAARTVGSTPVVGKVRLGSQEAVQRRVVGVGGIGGGQRRGEGVPARRVRGPQPDEHAAGRDVGGVHAGERRGHGHVGGRLGPGRGAGDTDHPHPGEPAVGLPEALREPRDLPGQQQAQDDLVADVEAQVRGGGFADENLVGGLGGGRTALDHDRLGQARRMVGTAAERHEPDRRAC